MNMISRDRSTIDAYYLLPSAKLFFPGMKASHQIIVWRRLLGMNAKPRLESWEQKGEKLKDTH